MNSGPFLLFIVFMIIHALIQYYAAAAPLDRPGVTFFVSEKVTEPVEQLMRHDGVRNVYKATVGQHINISKQK